MVSLQAAFVALAFSGTGETVLYDFHAEWCGPCRRMERTVARLAKEGYPVRRVDIDQERALAARHGIHAVPTFVLVVEGREIGRLEGETSHGELEQLLHSGGVRRAGQEPMRARAQSPDQLASTHSQPAGKLMPAPDSGFRNHRPSRPAPRDSLEKHLLAATVRLKVDDGGSNSVGSGTIIDCRSGEALILTCGHIFRDSQGRGPIMVDTFGAGSAEGLPGRLISYDLTSDVGLVSFRPDGPVSTAPLAERNFPSRPRDTVVNVGCNHGAAPTVRTSHVTAINKYLGPPHLVVAGQPVQGRSGGGLFSAEGLVIGVCNAADPADDEGLYAALGSIHAELERVGLGDLWDADASTIETANQSLPVEFPSMLNHDQGEDDSTDSNAVMNASPSGAEANAIQETSETLLSSDEEAALDEIRRRGSSAEVICIIRPLANPDAQSEILVLKRASPEFFQRLAAERSSGRSTTTIARRPTKPRQPKSR